MVNYTKGPVACNIKGLPTLIFFKAHFAVKNWDDLKFHIHKWEMSKKILSLIYEKTWPLFWSSETEIFTQKLSIS